MYLIRKQLIKSLSQTLIDGVNELGEKYQAVQMLPVFQKKHLDQLKPEIISARFYQTEHACYLETTIDEYKEKGIDPEDPDSETPYEEYSRVNYRIHRESLAFIAAEDNLAYHPKKPVLDNAADFIEFMNPYSLINCTDLFTKEAENKIAKESQSEIIDHDPEEPTKYVPGEIIFSGHSLKDLDGYDSQDDPDFPETPLAKVRIDEELTEILLTQNDKHVGKGQLMVKGNTPLFIEIESTTIGDDRLTTLSIPNEKIKAITVKAGNEPYYGYNLPGKYEYLIELTSGEKLIITGEFGEDSDSGSFLPEYWYYLHMIRVE